VVTRRFQARRPKHLRHPFCQAVARRGEIASQPGRRGGLPAFLVRRDRKQALAPVLQNASVAKGEQPALRALAHPALWVVKVSREPKTLTSIAAQPARNVRRVDAQTAIMAEDIPFAGVDGQGNFPMSGHISFSWLERAYQAALRGAILAALLTVTGCESYTSVREGASASLGTGRTFAIYGLEGRWAGDVTPVAADCGVQTRGSMTITARGFAFDPFGGTFVVTGTVSDDGALHGVLKRVLSGESGKHVERSLSFSGIGQRPDRGEESIVGRLESGRCAWRVALQRG